MLGEHGGSSFQELGPLYVFYVLSDMTSQSYPSSIYSLLKFNNLIIKQMTTAFSHKKSVEVVWTSDQEASYTPL